MRKILVFIGSALIILIAGTATFVALQSVGPRANDASKKATPSTPSLLASSVITGLSHPWDVDFLPDGRILFTERSGDISFVRDGKKQLIQAIDDVEATGEGGLMGLAVDPLYEDNEFVYICYNTARGDTRVVRWKLGDETLSDRRDIVTDIPTADSGRHSGCQIAFGPDDNLWIGTGDSADETQPQDRAKLGGKILRTDREGKAVRDNPDGPDTRVYSYGHRNTQALAFYASPKDTSYGYSIEHGPDRDDEVNALTPGNFGWNPGEGYDESSPMTDMAAFSDAIESSWSSGTSTIAPSGAAILQGSSWGRLEGWLALSVLKDQKILLLNISNGSVSGERSYFEREHGRLRAATLGPDGALYVSTDNGTNDSILRITTTMQQ